MKHDDAKILQEVQKSTEVGMTTIDTLLDMVEHDDFSQQLSRQSLRYSQIHDRALDQILRNEGEVCRSSRIREMLLKGSIHAGTALNISKGHLAELMIQHNRLATNEAVELAQELADFEQESIRQMRKYL